MVASRHGQGDSEDDSEVKSKVTPTKGKGGVKEVGLNKKLSEEKRQEEEEPVGRGEEVDDDDSEDGELQIADDEAQDDDDDEKESDEDSDDSDEADDGQQFTGTMTRRQSKQLKEAGEGLSGSAKKKNRTCEYCGVVKATPAALVRHIRKHTGERPFVCKLCGKAYKAKRSLNLHENTQHNGVSKNSLPSQVSQDSSTSFNIGDHIQKQASPTPPISESTKSLLRETLESSRKAKDSSNTTTTVTTSFDLSAGETSLSMAAARGSERLSTPNLVNLLTSDISTKMEQAANPSAIPLTVSKSSVEATPNYILCSNSGMKQELENGILKTEADEEQAQDLSMPRKRKTVEPNVHSRKEFKCEFCCESFKTETIKASHTQMVHGIIINPCHSQEDKSHRTYIKAKHSAKATPLSLVKTSFTKIEPKPNAGPINFLLLSKHPANSLSDLKNNDLAVSSFSSMLTKKSHQSVSPSSPVVMDVGKSDAVVVTMPTGDVPPGQDETNALPYHVTSRMILDFNSEDFAVREFERTVLAEDGGHRKCRITVTKETVLATRLDGINNITGRQATIYKCQLCQRIFSSLLRYNSHISSHHETEVTTYDCRYCEASFRSNMQIIKHLQCHREKFIASNNISVDDAHSQKKKSDFPGSDAVNLTASLSASSNNSNNIANLSSSVSPGSGKNSSSTSPLPTLEPGERINGGYPCGKCRKSFTREYLLQRHMRIHQNQSSFYCPDCESGFTGELDLMEHRKCYHGFKAPDDQQYHSLLSGLQAKASYNHIIQGKTINDSNNNKSGDNPVGKALSASSSTNTAGSLDPGFQVNRGGLYPMVDMKAIDLRHGEEVAVRMMESLEDKNKEELLKKAQAQHYNKQLLLKKKTEMAPMTLFSMMSQNQHESKDRSKEWQAALRAEHMKQMLMSVVSEEEFRKRLAEKVANEEETRRAVLKKLEEDQQAKLKRDDEKKRKLEQAQLKEKLAKEGMGDITVVLPVAPSPDVSSKERVSTEDLTITRLAVKVDESDSQQDVTHSLSSSSSRIDDVLEKEYGASTASELVSSETVPMDKTDNGKEKSMNLCVSPTGIRRPHNSVDLTGAPPSKSRRKALKPQKINHFTDDGDSKKGKELPTIEDNSSSTSNGEKNISSQHIQNEPETVQNHTQKGKTDPSSDAFLTYNGLQHLLAFRNSAFIPASDLTTGKGFSTLGNNPIGASSLKSKYYDKIVAGFDASGQPIMYNSNATNSGDEGDGIAMDLTTESSIKKKTKIRTTSSVNNKSSSPLSSSSSSPITMSYDIISSARQGSSSQGKVQRPKSLSRSLSVDRATIEQEALSHEYVSYSSPETDNKQDQQLNFKLALTQTQFSKALLANASCGVSSISSDSGPLIGLPRVLWSSSSNTTGKSGKTLVAGGGKTNGVSQNKNRASSPSPVPSPTNSDTSSSDGRKITSLSRTHSSARATSLSRTHSRLSVVQEPVDRNALCKPKVIENGKAVYTCAICSKNFLSLSDINRHMDFHEDIRPYKCKYCDYYARTNSQLKVHKLRHEGVREFCCRVCNYRGVTQSDLNRHMKSQVHLLRSNHICTHCGEGFVTPKTLQDHVANNCSGTRLDCFEKSFEHVGKSIEELEEMVDMEEGIDKEEEEESEEDMDEREVMDMRVISVGETSNGKEMKVLTAS